MHDVQFVPQCLRSIPQRVCWKYIERDGRRTKCPVNPRYGWNASATDPQTWGTFAEALAAHRRSDTYAGIGFAFSPDDPFCGIDLDDCLDESGDLLWGADIIEQFDTYTEISPSGRAVKRFPKGTKPRFAPQAWQKVRFQREERDGQDKAHPSPRQDRSLYTVSG